MYVISSVSADVQDQTNLPPRRKIQHLHIFFFFFTIQELKKWNAILGHYTGEVKYTPLATLTNPSGR